jgi:tRNA(fMet)-specific endonuclease VapC
MHYLLDTNILVYYVTKPALLEPFEAQHQPFANHNVAVISVVTEAELRSIAIQRGWGSRKKKLLNSLISQFLRIPVQTERQIDVYAEIDAYSKHKDPHRSYPRGYSSNTMGKNDIWIAATAHIIDAKLVTADSDFDHLNGEFIDLIKVSP